MDVECKSCGDVRCYERQSVVTFLQAAFDFECCLGMFQQQNGQLLITIPSLADIHNRKLVLRSQFVKRMSFASPWDCKMYHEKRVMKYEARGFTLANPQSLGHLHQALEQITFCDNEKLTMDQLIARCELLSTELQYQENHTQDHKQDEDDTSDDTRKEQQEEAVDVSNVPSGLRAMVRTIMQQEREIKRYNERKSRKRK